MNNELERTWKEAGRGLIGGTAPEMLMLDGQGLADVPICLFRMF
jgi:hypothetical protein